METKSKKNEDKFVIDNPASNLKKETGNQFRDFAIIVQIWMALKLSMSH